MTMMTKIVFPFTGDSVGGSHISALLLASNLDKSRFRPIILLHSKGILANYIQSQFPTLEVAFLHIDFRRRNRNAFSRLRNWLAITARITNFLFKERVDIVHTNDSRIRNAWVFAGYLSRAKTVHHHRNAYFGMGRLDRFSSVFIDSIICISNFNYKNLPKNLREKSHVVDNPFEVYPGDDVLSLRDTSRVKVVKELNLVADQPVVGFFGNITPQKNADIFVEAVVITARELNQKITAIICGEDRIELSRWLSSSKNNCDQFVDFHFTGFVFSIQKYIMACDVAVFPAENEGFGRVLVESMIVQTPVIALNSGGHFEIIDSPSIGILVDQCCPSEFGKAIIEVLSSSSKREFLANNARKSATQRFSAERHAELVGLLYDNVLKMKR